MKSKITTCFATLVVLVFIAGQQVLQAGETIEKVLVEKQFDVNQQAKLNITHEFGKVYCKNWDKSVISVKITAKVTARSAEKANDVMDRIMTDVSGDRNEVNASCKLSSGGNNSGKQQIEITMEVMMPKSVSLDLDHSFGSAWIGEVTGDATIQSQYGDLTAISFTGINNQIEVSFGNAVIELVSDAKLEVSYGHMDIKKAANINLETEYSDAIFGELNTAKIELEGGHFEVKKINVVEGESNFSNIKIGHLSQSARIEMNYGGLDLLNVEKGFSNISLETEFSSTHISFAPGTSYQLTLDSEFGSVDFPEGDAEVSKDIQDITNRHIEAVVGTKNTTSAVVNIESSYGSIKIN
ncbi:MAG: hypothetical protein Q8O72_06225 [Bacteroidales bacterium]|nr:hypothetical protein [Bacteroidales bacterium]